MVSRFSALLALAFILGACGEVNGGVIAAPRGAVSIALGVTASEIGVEAVEYTIAHPTALPAPIVGIIDLGPSAGTSTDTPFGFTTLLPPGIGYELTLIATDVDGNAICESFSLFDVVADQTTTARPLLNCGSMVP